MMDRMDAKGTDKTALIFPPAAGFRLLFVFLILFASIVAGYQLAAFVAPRWTWATHFGQAWAIFLLLILVVFVAATLLSLASLFRFVRCGLRHLAEALLSMVPVALLLALAGFSVRMVQPPPVLQAPPQLTSLGVVF